MDCLQRGRLEGSHTADHEDKRKDRVLRDPAHGASGRQQQRDERLDGLAQARDAPAVVPVRDMSGQ